MTNPRQHAKITITPEQRDALYEAVILHLSGIGDVALAIEREDFHEADRLGRAFADDLRVVLDDLGWGKHGGDAELTAPPDVLRRVLHRVRERAEDEERDEAKERAELAKNHRQNLIVREACDRVLRALDRA
ncbi:MAG: hypothetical protein ACM3Q9_02005 [Methanosarcina sp.]